MVLGCYDGGEGMGSTNISYLNSSTKENTLLHFCNDSNFSVFIVDGDILHKNTKNMLLFHGNAFSVSYIVDSIIIAQQYASTSLLHFQGNSGYENNIMLYINWVSCSKNFVGANQKRGIIPFCHSGKSCQSNAFLNKVEFGWSMHSICRHKNDFFLMVIEASL